jgi:hypothetical protein
MWCRRCAQDVPGVPSLEEGKYACARCAGPLVAVSALGDSLHAREASARAEPAKRKATEAGLRQPPPYDGWAIEEQLRHAFRVLGPPRAVPDPQEKPAKEAKFRVDAAHRVPAPHALKKRRRTSRRIDRATAAEMQSEPTSFGSKLLGVFVWSVLILGTTAFGCGLALLGWSSHTGRRDLWSLGAPIILAAQIALVLGLILQLDRIWRDHRRAAAKLRTVDQQIHDLKATTSLLGTTHGPSAAFYAHWAGGAGSDILLSDLKSQLDLLAVKMSKE